MKRAIVVGSAVVLAVVLLLAAHLALAPRWNSEINNASYDAYAAGNQLTLCAQGYAGNVFLNFFTRIGILPLVDNFMSECVKLDFASGLAPGTYSLSGQRHVLSSGGVEPRPATPPPTPGPVSVLFERTCFCGSRDSEVPFDGELIIESLEPLKGKLKLTIPNQQIDIDARLSAFEVHKPRASKLAP